MEAKDTVMSDEQMKEVIKENIDLLDNIGKAPELLFRVAKAQAKVSFKVGREQGILVANIANSDNLRRMRQAEISFKLGQDSEKAIVRGIYKDANDLKELETLIKEYLDTTPGE